MDSERWLQIDNLLQSVLERRPDERDAFLRQACAGDQALEREVRSLLTAQQKAGSFLESPAIDAAARATGAAARQRHKRQRRFSSPAAPCPITASWESWAVAGWVSFTRPRTLSWVALSP